MTNEQEQKYRDTLAKASVRIKELMAQLNVLKGTGRIAVIGIGCRFPGGADSPEAFWNLLADGVDTVNDVPADRWHAADWYHPDPSAAGKSYTKRGAFLKLDELKQFDASCFGISPLEAASLDPQQRLLLETSYEAVQRSGADLKSVRGSKTGVFVGACGSDYAQGGMHSGDTAVINPYSLTGVLPSVASGRISYLLDLHGPNLSLDTACSSSLVALLLAVKSLLSHECDAALAGGVSLMLTPASFVALSRMSALSPDGVCRPFADNANGYVRGEGCGMVYLKRLEDAERQGDPILAVLRGGAMSHDGQSNGLTAPNALSQQEVIRCALSHAGMQAQEIDAVETHGTGTPLGDPIEVRSLAAVFGGRTELPVGSVKGNIGHLEMAAGIAGAIKAMLMVNRGALPPSLHALQLNSRIPWDGIPVRVVRELRPFPDTGRLRSVGVSSFGFSGTNAHLIVQEYRRGDGTAFPLAPHPTQSFLRQPHWIDPMGLYNRGRSGSFPASHPEEKETGAQEMIAAIIAMVSSVSGLPAATLDPDANLFELGLDSLMLIQLRDMVNRDYGVTLEMSHLIEETNTLSRLAGFVSRHALLAEPASQLPPTLPAQGVAGGAEAFFNGQLDEIRSLMHRQLDALHQGGGPSPAERKRVNFRLNMLEDETGRLTGQQLSFVTELVARHTSRTPRSKELAQRHRKRMSDWISTLAFRGCLKEMVYPIASASSAGSRFVDVDGNSYLDLAMGFGVEFFGHSPAFVTEAIRERLDRGLELATQLPEAGAAAELFCRLTGMERVTFCNTGSEAVMMALRIARTVTARDRIVIFAGSYHGISDGVLALSDDTGAVFPTTPGVTFGAIGCVTVLPYGTQESLETLRRISGQLAAILVEPVQSRRPGFQPVQFLRELRSIADQGGAALIFDEMITGFRSHPGGVQALFGIRADLATYGKAVGGGMPISMVAGSARFMDAVDGGFWQYGDHSRPEAEVMFFGGTFCRHPLALASSLAVLRHMEEEGPALQQSVNGKTARLARELNAFFVLERVPMLVQHFGSLFRFESYGKYALLLQPLEMDLFFYLLMGRGIYTWERRICFLSTAHSDQDVDLVVAAVKESIRELRAGGFPFEGAPPEQRSDERHPLPHPPPLWCGSQGFPMSSAQKRLYILSQYEEGEGPYHLSGATLVEGPLDLDRLQTVFNLLIERHESLRTGFDMQDGELVQLVRDAAPLAVTRLELAEEEAPQAIARLITPFDLAHPPLLRIMAVKTGPDRHIVVLDSHHIALDGFSLNILIGEFMRLYAGEELTAVAPQYRDYVGRQRSYLESGQCRSDERFWLERLSGEIPVLQLPYDFSRPPRQRFSGDVVRARYDREFSAALKQAAAKSGTTLFIFLLAGFAALLNRLSGQGEIVIGVPVSSRDNDTLTTVGMFANTLPLRIAMDASLGFDALIRTLTRETFTAFEHQQYPLELIVDRLNLPVDTGRNPLFDAGFSFENADERGVRIENLTARHFDLPRGVSMFDLSLEVIEEQGGLRVTLEFATSLFRKESVERWGGYYRNILEGAVKNPGRPTGEIEMLSPCDRDQLIVGWNATAVLLPQTGIVQLFEAQAEKTPEAVALVFGTQNLSYGELNARANRLAHTLIASGVAADAPVGIALERSPEMIVALLAVLKAGGAYLPLDPDYPAHRLAFMLEDSGARIVITLETLRPGLPQATQYHLCLDAEGATIAAQPEHNPDRPVAPEQLAYVIYTSGSTGKPKGVAVEHGSLAQHCHAIQAYFELTPGDRVLQFASFSFDASVEQIVPTLCCGAALILPVHGLASPEELDHFLRQHRVSVAHLPPAFFEQWIAQRESGSTDIPLRLLQVGGDVLTSRMVAGWRACLPSTQSAIRLLNGYGPTEATVTTTFYEIPELLSGSSVPIGRPLPKRCAYVLDGKLQPTPIGVPGELHIGGAGVARGYLNRPELSAEKFIPDPFGSQPGARLYKTGDLVRYRGDGNLEFLGRIDHQVKIRGYRIELGEIEAALAAHPAVREAVVIAQSEADGDQRLVAYIVAGRGEAFNPDRTQRSCALPTVPDLRAFLKLTLPDYMLPARYLFLAALPLTANGKVDRKALPAEPPVVRAAPAPRDKGVASELEEQIAALWEDLLGVGDFGREDSFFSIGGHSLKAVRVVARMQKELGIALKLKDFFANPTVAGLAAVAARQAGKRPPETIPRLRDAASYQLSHAQKRLWLLDQTGQGGASYNMSGSWLIEGVLDLPLLQRSFQAITARHESFRTSFAQREGVPCQVIAPEVAISIVETDLRGDPRGGEHARELAETEGMTPFTLSEAPLLRILLIKLPAGEDAAERFVLVVTMHHIIGDGWSVGVLMREMTRLYAGEAPENLPDQPIRYRDYAAWHNCMVAGEFGKEAGAYWRETLSGEIAPLELRTDFPRPDLRSGRGGSVALELGSELTKGVQHLAAQHGATLFMVLLAGIKALLHARSGQDDILVGAPVAGREHPDLESQIGFYLNTLPLRSRIVPADSFATLLCQVKKMVEAAFAHQEYPFDLVVEDLGLQQDQGRNPLFDVLFVLQNNEPAQVSLAGARVSPFLEGALMSKFDLMFDLVQDAAVTGNIEYSADLYRPETVAQLGLDLRKLLQAVVAEPAVTLAGLDRLLAPEVEEATRHLFAQASVDVSEDF